MRFTFGAIFFLFYSVCLVGDLIICLLRFFVFLQILRIMFFVHLLVFLAILVFVAVLMLFLVFLRFLMFFAIARLGWFALHDFLRLSLRRFGRANCNEHDKNQNNAQPHRGIDARRSEANLTRCEKLLGFVYLRLTTPAVRARALYNPSYVTRREAQLYKLYMFSFACQFFSTYTQKIPVKNVTIL